MYYILNILDNCLCQYVSIMKNMCSTNYMEEALLYNIIHVKFLKLLCLWSY